MKKKIVINQCFGGFNLSPLAVQWLRDNGLDLAASDAWDDNGDYIADPVHEFDYPSQIPRHHPLLIACVEQLGAEADGECAKLRVLELPGNRYIITESSGDEWVTTPETAMWTVID